MPYWEYDLFMLWDTIPETGLRRGGGSQESSNATHGQRKHIVSRPARSGSGVRSVIQCYVPLGAVRQTFSSQRRTWSTSVLAGYVCGFPGIKKGGRRQDRREIRGRRVWGRAVADSGPKRCGSVGPDPQRSGACPEESGVRIIPFRRIRGDVAEGEDAFGGAPWEMGMGPCLVAGGRGVSLLRVSLGLVMLVS